MKKIRNLIGIIVLTVQDTLFKSLIIWSVGSDLFQKNLPREFKVEKAEAYLRRRYDERTRILATSVFLCVVGVLSAGSGAAFSGPELCWSACAAAVTFLLIKKALFFRR